MCGRFTLRAPASVVAEQFSIFEIPSWKARYNIAPSQPVAAVRSADIAAATRELAWLRWGLIPGWASDPSIGNRLINARAETVADKPAFRTAFRRRRCLIVADGFYEWQRVGKGRQPHLIGMRNGHPFAFAGLWETWEGPQHSSIESCTILTTTANDLVRPIHDRMPVILAPAEYDCWLDPAVSAAEKLSPLLRPYPSEPMASYRVSPWVNSPANDDPRCAEPSEGVGGGLGSP
jgi:putative SOS response-associated peptidase YedK